MDFVSRYIAKEPIDEAGHVDYTAEEDKVWKILFERQMAILPGRADKAFIDGINLLGLTADKVPQIPDVNEKLSAITGWRVAPVTALISSKKFFTLLANKQFPAATFIRTKQELDYVTEPDIFHEIYGHCPMLTVQRYADFMQAYAKNALECPHEMWLLLLRLFWFTVEFGLIETTDGLRAYGGGILSSFQETQYCVESNIPERVPFNPIEALRTPYRIDELQRVYFTIKDFTELYELTGMNPQELVKKAKSLGEHPPKFSYKVGDPNVFILAC